MAEVIREEPSHGTVVVNEHDHDTVQRSNAGLIAVLIIIGLIIVFLLAGNPFGGSQGGTGGSGGSGGETNINVQPPSNTPQY